MTILHFKVVLAAIFIKININNRKIRPYSQFHSLITSKCVPLSLICGYFIIEIIRAYTALRKHTLVWHQSLKQAET